jgi:putative ABC transport system ATP-binding protein
VCSAAKDGTQSIDARLLSAEGLTLIRDQQTLLTIDSLLFRPGLRYLITGPSGGGKSTLLRALIGLDQGHTGNVRYDDTPLDRWPATTLRRRVAYLPQQPVMVEGSIRDNLWLPLSLKAYRGWQLDESSVRELMSCLDLNLELETCAKKLSPGQQSRVALLQRLLLCPEVLLCDEPFAALDPANAERAARLLDRFLSRGMTQVIVSHQPVEGLKGEHWILNENGLIQA